MEKLRRECQREGCFSDRELEGGEKMQADSSLWLFWSHQGQLKLDSRKFTMCFTLWKVTREGPFCLARVAEVS